MVASNPKLSDSIKVILSCAKPKYGQIPNWFNAQGVYGQICKDKMIMDVSLQVVKFGSDWEDNLKRGKLSSSKVASVS